MKHPQRRARPVGPPPDSLHWDDRNLMAAAGVVIGPLLVALLVAVQILIEWRLAQCG